MFNTKKKNDVVGTGMINTIIGDNSTIEGTLYASDSTRVDGQLKGKILSENTVIIGEHGLIKGDIDAVEILVAGTVYGNLRAKERIEITETGSILGDLVTKTLVVDEGASIKGNCTMEVVEEKPSGDPEKRSQEERKEGNREKGPEDTKGSGAKEAAATAETKKK